MRLVARNGVIAGGMGAGNEVSSKEWGLGMRLAARNEELERGYTLQNWQSQTQHLNC